MADSELCQAAADRSLLIALNASSALSRAAACRLATDLDAWRHPSDLALDARRVGVPPAALGAARELVPKARGLAARQEDEARRQGASIFTLLDRDLAERFVILDLPPPAIYVQGELPDGPAVAVVGARRASRYGIEIASWFGRELAAAGVTVVSGFAVGIDAAAHRGALTTPGGRTVAVLGCGIDIDYPRGQLALAREITARGARLTEYPCGRGPLPWHFPVRNRLIAALANACVVIEAAPRSGSLVTARLALELGREVLAVPGRVDQELALGSNQLLADGARPALDPRDVLESIGIDSSPVSSRTTAEPTGLVPSALALWRAARTEPDSPEALAARCGLAIDQALVELLELELAGRLRKRSDGRYAPVE